MEQSLRSALRDRTGCLHARLDTALTGPEGRVPDVAAYVRVLRTLHALHALADGPLSAWAQAAPVARGLDPASIPDRTGAYADDLRALGVETEPVEPARSHQTGDARGLALLYLVAGSAAGARVVLRGLPPTVPVGARSGLTSAADPASTRLWRQTCVLLSQPFEAELRESVVTESRAVLEELIGRQELVAS